MLNYGNVGTLNKISDALAEIIKFAK